MTTTFDERFLLLEVLIDYKAELSAQIAICEDDLLRKLLESHYTKAKKAIDLIISSKNGK